MIVQGRSASERKLDLFPLQRITSSDVILARTSQDAACSATCQTVKILFAPHDRVRTGPGKPGKSWKFKISKSRPGKPGKYVLALESPGKFKN